MNGYPETPATKLRRLQPAELEQARAALAAEGLPTEDLRNPAATFYALEENGEALGYAGLEGHGRSALLRSVVVLAEKRRLGWGGRLVEAVLDQAVSTGHRDIYLLTTTVPGFFLRLGFTRTDRAKVPTAIASTSEFAELCPATAVCMHRRLASEGDLRRA